MKCTRQCIFTLLLYNKQRLFLCCMLHIRRHKILYTVNYNKEVTLCQVTCSCGKDEKNMHRFVVIEAKKRGEYGLCLYHIFSVMSG